jgi:hypothetical protein
MDVEKNCTSTLDREKELFSFGRRETQKITISNNPPIKATLFWSRHDSKRVTRTGHYAWTGCRIQEAGKATNALARQYQGGYQPMIGSFERNSMGQEKVVHAGGRKDSE